MTKKDWYETGDQILGLVQDAIDRKDYSRLSSAINSVVNEAMDSVERELRNSFGAAGSRTSGGPKRSYSGRGAGDTAGSYAGRGEDELHGGRAADGSYAGHGEARSNGGRGADGAGPDWTRSWRYGDVRDGRSEAADRIRSRMEQKVSGSRSSEPKPSESKTSGQYCQAGRKLRVPGQIAGNVMKWTGYACGGMLGLSLALVGVVGMTTEINVAVAAGILGVLFAGSVLIGAQGSGKLALARRFRKYTEVLGERTFCLVEELASAVGENSRFVRRDLRKMIRRGFFPQAYLDQKETCLITDRETYRQYLETQQSYEARKEAEKKEAGSGNPEDGQEGQTQTRSPLTEEGMQYIRHIRTCNDLIADEEISGKLDRLEMVVTRIFTEAEKNPETAADLQKMMSYYLPTTKKLLDAYCELDAQPIQGQNIEKTKKEIEDTLDTLNEAFERLLDSLFEEKAWDISSDISVLNSMLAQEGLTGSDFESGKL